jgi:hypothetical protein
MTFTSTINLKSSEYSAQACWFLMMAIAVGSVFTLNALIPRIPSSGWKWLWMLQALTPLVTFNMLGSIEINVRPSSEDNIIVMSVLCSMVSVPALALV